MHQAVFNTKINENNSYTIKSVYVYVLQILTGQSVTYSYAVHRIINVQLVS
jgi:hypothetical protein